MLPLSSAAENIPRADLIRTLIKDIWDLRTAKLRSSIDTFIRSDTTHAKVNEATDIRSGEHCPEICCYSLLNYARER